jgi:AcrR family transcriptional regulator
MADPGAEPAGAEPAGAEPARTDAARTDAGRPLRADAARPLRADAARPLRADAARNREKVLRAAREVFAESGYGVPLDEIAARAGVGPGTVYRHFPTKEALFEAVVAARLRDLVTDACARAGSSDPGDAFFGFLGRVAAESAAKRDLPDAISVAGSLRDELNAALEVLLQRAQRAGAVRADIRTPDVIVLLKGLFASLADVSDPVQRDLVFTVLADGLRQPR